MTTWKFCIYTHPDKFKIDNTTTYWSLLGDVLLWLCFSCSCCFCCYCCCCCCFCCYCICSAITECCHNRTLWREKSCIIRLNCLQIPLQHIFFSFRNNKSQKVWIVPWYSIHMPHHSMLFSIIIMINIYMCINNFTLSIKSFGDDMNSVF